MSFLKSKKGVKSTRGGGFSGTFALVVVVVNVSFNRYIFNKDV